MTIYRSETQLKAQTVKTWGFDLKNGYRGSKTPFEFCCERCEIDVINHLIKQAKKRGFGYKYITNKETKYSMFIVCFDKNQDKLNEFYSFQF